MSDLDADFLACLQQGRLESLDHQQHLRAAWVVLQRHPLQEAIPILRSLFRDFATIKGKPELFHETITWSFIVLIHERIVVGRGGENWQQFLRFNPDLNRGQSSLLPYYHQSTLNSHLARSTFVLPDRGLPASRFRDCNS